MEKSDTDLSIRSMIALAARQASQQKEQ